MSQAPTLTDVINAIINAFTGIAKAVADAVSANATTIGTVVVLAGLAYMAYRIGRQLFGWVRGLLPF